MGAEPTCAGHRGPTGDSRADRPEVVEAVLAIMSELRLGPALHAVVRSAMDLVDSRYGALHVTDRGDLPSAFIHEGADDETREKIGWPPLGRGVLAWLEDQPGTVRIPDLRDHPAAIGFPPQDPEMTSLLGTPIWVRGELYGHLYLAGKSRGGGFSESDETIIETLAVAAGIAIDNARTHELARLRLRWIEATRDIRTELLTGSDDREVLGLITRSTLGLADADLVFVAQPDDREGCEELTRLVITVASGTRADLVEGETIPVTGSTSGHVITSHEPCHGARLGYSVGGVTDCFGPVLAAPMRAVGHTSGVLVALRAAGRPVFTDTDVELTATFAGQAALALHLGVAARRARHLEIAAERERIAQDLHDHVIQRIFAEGLSLNATLRQPLPPEVRGRLTHAVDDLQEIIEEIRATVYDLHSPDSHSVRLRQRLHDVIDHQVGDAPLRTRLRISGPSSVVDQRTAEHLLAVVRESASNVVRHARATSMTVTVGIGDDIVAEISDDGVGLGDDIHQSGLANLRRRAESLGGTMSATSQREGTTVRWSVPLR